jgi:hypothetical protein
MMAWTAPALGSEFAVAEVVTAAKMNTKLTDNLRYLKGMDSAVDIVNILNLKPAAANPEFGMYLPASSSVAQYVMYDQAGTYRAIAGFGGSTYATTALQNSFFFLTNGASGDVVFMPNGTEQVRYKVGGNVGIGTASPQGRLHAKGSIASAMLFEYDGVDNTARTVIADGAGDVLYSIVGMFTVRASDGGLSSGNVTANLGLSSGTDLYNPGGAGTNVCRLLTAANGSVTVQRTAGALTYKVALWLLWLSS